MNEQLSDLEIVRRCAMAMGLYNSEWSQFTPPKTGCGIAATTARGLPWFDYDPLHDDAQAMQLVKRFALSIRRFEPDCWDAWIPLTPADGTGKDLNRSICLCVAKMAAP